MLSQSDIEAAAGYAGRAQVGGQSQVRSGQDRQQQLATDQLVGQLGELALSKYLGGTRLFYELTRTIRDLDPHAGDGGGDLLATNVDVKCSLMRAANNPLAYRLLVRPRERHPNTVYVLALVEPDVWQTGKVCLVGWCKDTHLPKQPLAEGPFAGAHVVLATELRPLPPIEFQWLFNFRELTCRTPG
jgi:hypothetical protein